MTALSELEFSSFSFGKIKKLSKTCQKPFASTLMAVLNVSAGTDGRETAESCVKTLMNVGITPIPVTCTQTVPILRDHIDVTA